MALAIEIPTPATAWSALAEDLRRITVQVRGDDEPGGGAGVIWRADGLILTNAHVARAATATVELSDGRVFSGPVLARDPRRDLAAIRIPATDLPAATPADSDQVRPGELVLAVGNPLGMVGAVVMGIIHTAAKAGPGRQGWVQADIHLAPGNSGGPLVDVQGRVLGLNAMIVGGLGLAVPSNDIAAFVRALEPRAPFGVTVQPVRLDNGLGLLVLEVTPGSQAEQAGLALGDVIAGVAGKPLASPGDLIGAWQATTAGDALPLAVTRGGQPLTVAVRAAPVAA